MSVKALFGSSAAIDSIPNQFTFIDTSGVNPSTVTTSGTVTVNGLSPGIPITVTASGGTVDAGTSSLSGTYASSKSVTTSALGSFVMAARATSNANFSNAVNVTVTVNGVSDVYTVTTRAADTTPNAFTFTNVTSAQRNTVYSASVVPVGYDNALWSVPGGEGSTNNSTWSFSGSITSGQTFYIRRTSSISYSTAVSATANIGGTTSNFSITTRDLDATPNSFSFPTASNATRGSYRDSSPVIITGMDPGAILSITSTGGSFKMPNYEPETERTSFNVQSPDGTIEVIARVQASFNYSTSTTCNVSVNGVTGSFTVTTPIADTTPNAFTFTDRAVNYFLPGAYASTARTVSGMSPSLSVTVSASGSTGASVDAGTNSLSGTFAVSKTVTTSTSGTIVVAARVSTTSARSTAFNCVVNIGGVVDTFTCTTN